MSDVHSRLNPPGEGPGARIRRVLCGLAVAVALSACAGAPLPASTPAARPPNIVLIVSDDHAWTDYGFLGHPDVRTPNLDRLAEESLVYTRAYNPTALCRPSLASMITGLYPHEHGITGNDPPGGRPTMFDPAARAAMDAVFRRVETLPERLAERGYVSLQTGKWWEGDPRDHGFTAAMTHGDPTRGGRHGDEGLKIGREGMKPIFDFIDNAGERPFFVWYAPLLPHTPHDPPRRLLQRYEAPGRAPEVARYYAMVEWLDETVGELLTYLDDHGLRENTVVLYVADNGWVQPVGGGSIFETRSKMSPYDAGTRTALMIRWPGHVAPGRDDASLASTLDLAPTVLHMVGLTPPAALSGLDLRDRRALAARERLFGELFAHTAVAVDDPVANLRYRTVVRRDGWKLIQPYVDNLAVPLTITGENPSWTGSEPELYNVVDDPYEETDLARARPALVDELRASLERWWSVP